MFPVKMSGSEMGDEKAIPVRMHKKEGKRSKKHHKRMSKRS
jgi:hypothetical protein